MRSARCSTIPRSRSACVIGDGEAETGPLATAWHSNKFLNPATDGAVLPILHLNGYKIANPTILARIPREELDQLLRGYGWEPHYVEGHEPMTMHAAMAATLDTAIERIGAIQRAARSQGAGSANAVARPRWPMIVLISPKGWTGPKVVNGKQIEGTFRAHQVPITDPATNPAHLRELEEWLQQLSAARAVRRARADSNRSCGRSRPRASGAWGRIRTPTAGSSCATCTCRILPTMRSKSPTRASAASARRMSSAAICGTSWPTNAERRNFRLFGPDETLSNGLEAVFEATTRQWEAATIAGR